MLSINYLTSLCKMHQVQEGAYLTNIQNFPPLKMEHHTLNPLQQSQADYIASQLLSELSVGSGELESWPDKLKV